MARLRLGLVVALVVSGCGTNAPENTLSDAQTRAQVVDPAVEIVRVVALTDVTGAFSYGSCRMEGEPPFQGRVEVTFTLPPDPEKLYAQIRDAMVAQGWTPAAPEGDGVHDGGLNLGGVTATVGPRAGVDGYGALQLFGECRNTGDHGAQAAADITAELH